MKTPNTFLIATSLCLFGDFRAHLGLPDSSFGEGGHGGFRKSPASGEAPAASWVPESHCCHPSGTYMSLEGERSDAQHGVRPCAAGVGSAGEGLGNSSRDCIFEIAVLVCICRLPGSSGNCSSPLFLFSFGDHFEWNKVTSCIHNILSGQRWIEHYGEIVIRNLNDDSCYCKVNFIKVNGVAWDL